MSDQILIYASKEHAQYSITVKKLRKILQQLPDDYHVNVSGATGYVGFLDLIEIDKEEGEILLHSRRK